MLENNTAPNTQIGRIDIWNTWKVKYYPYGKKENKSITCYVRDPGVAKDFPFTEIDKKKVPKKVMLFKDKDCTEFIAEVLYELDKFDTISYNKYYETENYYGNDKYSRGGDFIEDMVTDNPIVFMHRWFSFADIKEFLIDWKEYNEKFLKSFSRHHTYGRFNYIASEGRVLESPFYATNIKKESPFYYPNNKEKPLVDFRPMKGLVNLDEYNESKFNGGY
jgi:hypothetical protein